VVPIIRLSDQTQFTNFLGDKKAWPVYVTIANILSRTRNSPVKMPILLVALLVVPPKFSGESARTHEAQRQTNADVLRTVFDLVLGPLQQVVQEGMVMDCADGKTGLCFPILSGLNADHAKHGALHGVGSKSCPKCEVPCKEHGGNLLKMYETGDYILYGSKVLRPEPVEAARIPECFHPLGVKIGNNVFAGLDRVNPAHLHKPDLLHNIYLGLFKQMMDWVEGFLKQPKQQQAFEDHWKEILPYPGLSVPKKADREVTQWQGKERRNLGRCISAILASALRNPDSSQYHDFTSSMQCVSVLVDLSLMAQYHSHTPDTPVYMERYPQTFHRTKKIFLECRTSKATRAEANFQDRDLRELMATQRANEVRQNTAAKHRPQVDQERLERASHCTELIRRKNHFNFIKMHSLSRFASDGRHFGSIWMYSTEIGEQAHMEQIKESYRRSNKNEAARQILSQ